MLESRAVTRRFGSFTALDAVDLCLEPGHSYAMLGPNGSGKTTWMKLAADLMLPTSGGVFLNGRPVSRSTRSLTAYMSTENFLYPWMSIRDVGTYFIRFFPDYDLRDFAGMIGRMGLAPGMKVKALSTGMLAKLKVAATLARRAPVFLLDEPFNGIDLIARDQISAMIREHMTAETVMALSSHLVEELEGVTDRAVFMGGGKVLAVCENAALRAQGTDLSGVYRRTYGGQQGVWA